MSDESTEISQEQELADDQLDAVVGGLMPMAGSGGNGGNGGNGGAAGLLGGNGGNGGDGAAIH